MKFLPRFFFVSTMLFLFTTVKSQSCGTCSINITSLDSSIYTINSGETFCIDTTGNFIGTINLNGGTICNKGIFNPVSVVINSGSVSNYGNASFKTAVTINGSSQLTNNADAIININGELTMSGGSLTNDGIINVDQNIQNSSGTITNNSIMNCAQINGNGSLYNSGKINTN